ncbi:two-component system sensor histidine kinase ChiS [Paenibacillus sp. PastF-3]|uniref:hybrid sensor histidine kinase/response regulator n=1 Tax=Paenibacillus sp. PastF-3 TaxID=2940626 RepID=UPI002475FE79|nr:ATP-binding protein [Paenibacillus sp. PastF-3]MDH6374184.1 two-component system sensor histidine kinase ChiS [Paenibacillus sp. PastF-3]
MTKRKLFLIITLFLTVLTGFRILWVMISNHPIQPQLTNGVLDLRDKQLNQNNLFILDGQWEFYPNLLQPSFNEQSQAATPPQYIQVPGNWKKAFSDTEKSTYGYGSYRLRVLVDKDKQQSLGLLLSGAQTSSELYINGELLGSSGSPAKDKEHYIPYTLPYSVFYTTDKSSNEIEIVVQVANYSFAKKGGITKSIVLGSEKALAKQRMLSVGLQLLLCVVLMLDAVYAVILYIMGPRQKMLVYFFLLVISAIASVLMDDDKLLLHILPLNYQWDLKLLLISYLFTFIFILLTSKHLLFKDAPIKSVRILTILSIIHILFILVGPIVHYFEFYRPLFGINLLFLALGVMILFLRSILMNYEGAIFLLLSILAIVNSTLWGMFKNYNWVNVTYYPFDLMIAFLCFATFGFKRYHWNAKHTEKLAQSLQRSVTQKDDFLANTSHELQNPLYSIINMAETVLNSERPALSPQNIENLEVLITIGRRMSLLVDDLLDQPELRESNIQLQLRELKIQSFAIGVLDMFKFFTEGKSLTLISEIPDSFPSILADEKRLIQILFNLIQNSVNHTTVGTIRIHADIHKKTARIHISDTGLGMSEEMLHRAFQPYEQGDSSMHKVSGGIGLGLSTVKQLVELHGGKISVISALGQGTTFTFTMPLSEPANRDSHSEIPSTPEYSDTPAMITLTKWSTTSTASSTTGRRPRILAVDDDPVNLKILTSVLSIKDYEMVTVTSGIDALTKLDIDQWDLIITDVMMPQMSGYELTQRIRERFTIAELPILLLTARSQPEDIYTGFVSGANDYVMKPMNAMELRGRVRSLTDLKQSVNERLRLEAAYLQAQIQPHFLFNTLNSISALASFDTQRMSHLIDAFSSYLRLSFNFLNAEPMIPIEHELELVRAYLYIEKERFEDRMTINWDVAENLHFQLPPLTIQPLVENAVRHGILSRSKGGTLSISIKELADDIEITIADNGKGMTSKQLQQLLGSQSNVTRGIGFLNTHKRLLRVYAKGLLIKSKEGLGTSVSFIIPSEKRNMNRKNT